MTFFSRMMLIGLLIMMTTGALAKNSEAAYRDFWRPTYHGERLNYCSLDKKVCGKALATHYCKMMGYLGADQAIIDYNLRCTQFMPVAVKCRGWGCHGFKKIRCVANMSHRPPQAYHYRLRRFVYPYFNHYRVDWCYDGRRGCGHRAAYSFCRRMGYLGTRHYVIQEKIAATQAIGNQRLCLGKQCRAFELINCYR